jgi:hypothetical protein
MFAVCTRTVRGLSKSRSAISPFESPAATGRTSTSRGHPRQRLIGRLVERPTCVAVFMRHDEGFGVVDQDEGALIRGTAGVGERQRLGEMCLSRSMCARLGVEDSEHAMGGEQCAVTLRPPVARDEDISISRDDPVKEWPQCVGHGRETT